MVGMIPNACIETPKGFLVDNVWVAANLTSEAILGHSSLSAFHALTIRYGGTLPALEVHQITTTDPKTKSSFTTHQPVKCFSHLDRSQTPLHAPSRHHSSVDRDFIHSEVQRLKAEDKIRPSNSSWRSQAFIVHKIGQKPRMVIDYSQTVNRVTPLDAYPILLVADLLDQVNQYHHFSYIDLKSAFNQFRLDPTECHLTAFEAANSLWEFTCVPFGLQNSLAAFNRALS